MAGDIVAVLEMEPSVLDRDTYLHPRMAAFARHYGDVHYLGTMPSDRTNGRKGMLIDIGGYHLCLNQLGDGHPTVIFEAGLGDTVETWGRLPEAVAELTLACVYNRAGLGQSEVAPGRRTTGRIVDELRTLLARATITPPYVLVGHSHGGAIAYLYACRYPAEVAGLVLLDPGNPDLIDRLRPALSPALQEAFEERMVATYARIEGIDYLASIAEQRAASPLPPIPSIVFARGQTPPATGFLPGWPIAQTEPKHREMMADLATRTPHGSFQVAARSGHYIHRDEPDLVLTAIRRVVEMARGQADFKEPE